MRLFRPCPQRGAEPRFYRVRSVASVPNSATGCEKRLLVMIGDDQENGNAKRRSRNFW
jgi:hypothetical protein